MKKYSFYCLLLLVFFACGDSNDSITVTNPNQDWGDLQAQEVSSTLQENDNGWVIENNIFYPHSYAEGEKQYVFQINETQQIGTNGKLKDITISPIWSSEFNAEWSLHAYMSSFDFRQNILTTMLDNDTIEDYYVLYNIENGNQLIEYTYARLDAQFSQSEEKRFMGFLSQQSPIEFEGDNMLGVFTYANHEKALQQLIIKVKDPENIAYITDNTPDMKIITKNEDVILLNGDKTIYFSNLEENFAKDNIHFDVAMTTYLKEDYETIHFTIPIINDEINMDSLQYYEKIFDVELVDL